MGIEHTGIVDPFSYVDLETQATRSYEQIKDIFDADWQGTNQLWDADIDELVTDKLQQYRVQVADVLRFPSMDRSPLETVSKSIRFAANLSMQLVWPDAWGLSFARISTADGPEKVFNYMRRDSLSFMDQRQSLSNLSDRYMERICDDIDQSVVGRRVIGMTLIQVEDFRRYVFDEAVNKAFEELVAGFASDDQ